MSLRNFFKIASWIISHKHDGRDRSVPWPFTNHNAGVGRSRRLPHFLSDHEAHSVRVVPFLQLWMPWGPRFQYTAVPLCATPAILARPRTKAAGRSHGRIESLKDDEHARKKECDAAALWASCESLPAGRSAQQTGKGVDHRWYRVLVG